MSLKIRQDSAHQGGNWWKWSVWIEGGPREMAAVDHVVYTLHATFPDPVRTVRNRRTGFRLESSGWGEFELYARIVSRDGKIHQRKHWLTLDGEGKPAAAAAPLSSGAEAPAEPVAYLSAGSADAEVARHIRAEPWGKAVILVAMTGWGQAEDKRRAFEAGFGHHFTKPLDLEVLDAFLADALAEPRTVRP